MDRPVPDHRGPELPGLVSEVTSGLTQIFQTASGEIVLFPGSGTGGWEASIVNTLNPHDRVLAFNVGQFSHQFAECAPRLDMVVDEKRGLLLAAGVRVGCGGEGSGAGREGVGSGFSFLAVRPVGAEVGRGFFPYAAGRGMLSGLREAIGMRGGGGLAGVFARHAR